MYCKHCHQKVGYAKTHVCPVAGLLDHSDNFTIHELPKPEKEDEVLPDKDLNFEGEWKQVNWELDLRFKII